MCNTHCLALHCIWIMAYVDFKQVGVSVVHEDAVTLVMHAYIDDSI